MRIFLSTIFILVYVATIVLALMIGLYGGEQVTLMTFGSCLNGFCLDAVREAHPIASRILPLAGAILSAAGLFFLVVIPLSAIFPSLFSVLHLFNSKPRSPPSIRRFFQWYAAALNEFVDKYFCEPGK